MEEQSLNMDKVDTKMAADEKFGYNKAWKDEIVCKETLQPFTGEGSHAHTTYPVESSKLIRMTEDEQHISYPYRLKHCAYTERRLGFFIKHCCMRKESNLTPGEEHIKAWIKDHGRTELNIQEQPLDIMKFYFNIFNEMFFGGWLTGNNGGYSYDVVIFQPNDPQEVERLGVIVEGSGYFEAKFDQELQIWTCTIWVANEFLEDENQDHEQVWKIMLGHLAHEMIHALFMQYAVVDEQRANMQPELIVEGHGMENYEGL